MRRPAYSARNYSRSGCKTVGTNYGFVMWCSGKLFIATDIPSVNLALVANSRGFKKVYSALVSLHLQQNVITRPLKSNA
jgi:hypothetical protein